MVIAIITMALINGIKRLSGRWEKIPTDWTAEHNQSRWKVGGKEKREGRLNTWGAEGYSVINIDPMVCNPSFDQSPPFMFRSFPISSSSFPFPLLATPPPPPCFLFKIPHLIFFLSFSNSFQSPASLQQTFLTFSL